MWEYLLKAKQENFPKHIKKSYANGLRQRSCGCIVVLICIHCGSSWQGLLFAFTLNLQGSSQAYITQSQQRDIRCRITPNTRANTGVKYCVCLCDCVGVCVDQRDQEKPKKVSKCPLMSQAPDHNLLIFHVLHLEKI